MASGKLVSFDGSRGFGFIRPDDGGPDVFVHVNDIGLDEEELRQGRVFEFDMTEGDRGPKAVNLKLSGNQPSTPAVPRSRGRDRSSGQLSATEHQRLITELLLEASPALTAGEILTIRDRLTAFADQHGWLEG